MHPPAPQCSGWTAHQPEGSPPVEPAYGRQQPWAAHRCAPASEPAADQRGFSPEAAPVPSLRSLTGEQSPHLRTVPKHRCIPLERPPAHTPRSQFFEQAKSLRDSASARPERSQNIRWSNSRLLAAVFLARPIAIRGPMLKRGRSRLVAAVVAGLALTTRSSRIIARVLLATPESPAVRRYRNGELPWNVVPTPRQR